jgi:Leishmanolysin
MKLASIIEDSRLYSRCIFLLLLSTPVLMGTALFCTKTANASESTIHTMNQSWRRTQQQGTKQQDTYRKRILLPSDYNIQQENDKNYPANVSLVSLLEDRIQSSISNDSSQINEQTSVTLKTRLAATCRFGNRSNYYPCNNGLGVLIRKGTQFDPACVEQCFPLLTFKTLPAKYQCGSCYGRPTRTPISPAPISPAPASAPIPTVPVPTSVPTQAPASSSFEITVDLVNVPTSDTVLFQSAAKRWDSIVVQGLPNVTKNPRWPKPLQGCSYPNVINDVYICGVYTTIDGLNGILGSAGPTIIRSDDPKLPILGRLKLDIVDVASMRIDGTLAAVILHEIGHVLGIGTLWKTNGLINATQASCPYSGTNANREYSSLTGCSRVPIEAIGGDRTNCSHFDDYCLQTELMTGVISSTNPLSKITVAALQDVGYTAVDYKKADSYTRRHVNNNCICNRRLLEDPMMAQSHTSLLRRNQDNEKNVFWLQEVKREQEHVNSLSSDVTLTSHQRRKLSDTGRAVAMTYGKKLLRQAKRDFIKAQQQQQQVGADQIAMDKKTKFVAADVVSVLYSENGQIFGVIVRSDT